MTVSEFNLKIENIRKNNPQLDIDKLEIAPLFNNGILMMVSDIYIVNDGAWNKTINNGNKAIAIEWHC